MRSPARYAANLVARLPLPLENTLIESQYFAIARLFLGDAGFSREWLPKAGESSNVLIVRCSRTGLKTRIRTGLPVCGLLSMVLHEAGFVFLCKEGSNAA